MKHIEKEAELVEGRATSKTNLVTLFSSLDKFNYIQQKYIKEVEEREDGIDIYEVIGQWRHF